jgi:hypothetical protein
MTLLVDFKSVAPLLLAAHLNLGLKQRGAFENLLPRIQKISVAGRR